LGPWTSSFLEISFRKRVQQNNDSDHNGAESVRRSSMLARDPCESFFCCSDFQKSFGGGKRSWDPWTLRFLVFPFGNRVQQNNDSHVNGAGKLGESSRLARELCESLFCCNDFQKSFGGDERSWGLGLLTSWKFLLEI